MHKYQARTIRLQIALGIFFSQHCFSVPETLCYNGGPVKTEHFKKRQTCFMKKKRERMALGVGRRGASSHQL